VNRTYRPLFRLALIGVLVLACGLSACGRKGPLEAPPGSLALTHYVD
jgi:predicted small lipoprotein YifL